MTRRLLLKRRVAVFGVGVLLLAACGGTGDDASGSDGADSADAAIGTVGDQQTCDQPVSGGTLTLADFSEARSLDPTKTIATGFSGGTALAAVYDVLVRYDPETREFEPQLAEGITPNEDFTQWTVTLRDGVMFSDGTPLDAEAVVNSVNWYLENGGFDGAVIAPSLGGVEATDEKTVVFDLTTPWASFPAMLGQAVGMIVAPAAIAGEEFEPIGAGPFTLGNYAPQEELVLEARDDYWDGAPNLDELRLVWFNSDEARIETLESGGVQAAVLRYPQPVQDAKDAGYSGFANVQDLGSVVMLNNAEGSPAEDPKVRQAIALAVDLEVLNQRVYGGIEVASKALFPEVSQWHADDVEINPLDAEQARTLVEEAKAEGFDGKLNYLGNNSPSNQNQALALETMLEAVGFEVENELLASTADIIQRVFVARDYDLAQSGLSVSEEDPYQRLYSSFHSKSVSNALGYASPEMDELILELQGTDGDARQDVLSRIEAQFQADVPTLSLSPQTPFVPWQDDVHGIQPINEGMLAFADAWIGECDS